MLRALATACALVAGCTQPTDAVFEVDGYNNTVVGGGSVLALWTVPGSPARTYKLGDGVAVDNLFTIAWEADPPLEALSPEGLGVATLVLLPPRATVPDGPTDPNKLVVYGQTFDSAVIYKVGTGGLPWAADLPPRFSCARCVRNGSGLATYELAPCVNVVLEDVGGDPCAWY